jgi:high-affinity Fe2+/Pb2+ permease
MWVYTAGALCYTVPRIIAAFNNLKSDSLRIKRLRRMEMWAGIAFCLGAAFWIYNYTRFLGFFNLKVINETITFTIVGAVIQMIGSWLLSSAQKKQEKEKTEKGNAEKGK